MAEQPIGTGRDGEDGGGTGVGRVGLRVTDLERVREYVKEAVTGNRGPLKLETLEAIDVHLKEDAEREAELDLVERDNARMADELSWLREDNEFLSKGGRIFIDDSRYTELLEAAKTFRDSGDPYGPEYTRMCQLIEEADR